MSDSAGRRGAHAARRGVVPHGARSLRHRASRSSPRWTGDEPVGVSANAFTSVSLDPPLVLFCAAKASSTWPKIEAAGKFTVNILNEHQEDVCRVFATKGADRFTRIGWRPSANGNPILHDALAYIDCTIETHRTTAATTSSSSGASQELGISSEEGPLLFYRGGYGALHGLTVRVAASPSRSRRGSWSPPPSCVAARAEAPGAAAA